MTSTGHIYKIICRLNQEFCYIGSTFDTLHRRFNRHRGHYNDWISGKTKAKCSCYPHFQKYGIENFKIILIKSYEVCRTSHKDTKHLRAYETLFYNKTKCVNKNAPVNYINLEKKREYYQANKEQILAKQKMYIEENRDDRRKAKREHYEINKDTIKKKQATPIKCEFCGILSTYGHLARHQRTKTCMAIAKKN